MRTQKVAVIGAPMDLGAGRRGVDMGPSAVRAASLHARLSSLGYDVEDLGNIDVVQPEAITPKPSSARFLPEIAASCSRLARMVERAAGEGKFPIILGGDHSIAAGSIAGMAKHYRKSKRRIGVIWIDAHADMNTPATSHSGNVHGMSLASTLGLGPEELTHIGGYAPKVKPENAVLIGIRDVDEMESGNVTSSGIHAFTMRDVDELGMRTVITRAVEAASRGTDGIHLSFDMDSVDPDEAPGVGTPVRGGLTYREAYLAMEMLSDTELLRSIEVVEVNPILDTANRTALLAVELIASAMGKRILQ